MKLDANVLRYLTKEEFRVLTAVEQGQKNVREARPGLATRIRRRDWLSNGIGTGKKTGNSTGTGTGAGAGTGAGTGAGAGAGGVLGGEGEHSELEVLLVPQHVERRVG